MVIVTHKSYDGVLVGTGKQKGCLKTASDGAYATWRGRSFQTVAPETGNARLPTVERRTGRTSRRWELPFFALVGKLWHCPRCFVIISWCRRPSFSSRRLIPGDCGTLPQNVTSLTVLRKTHLFSYSFHQSPFAPAQWLCHFGHLYSRTLP